MSLIKTEYVKLEKNGCYVTVSLNRPQMANALTGEMLEELSEVFRTINDDCLFLILKGEGKNFCAGADLNWMKASKDLSEKENIEDSKKLISMFESLIALKIPTFALVTGAAYGGAVGLIAACDYAIASEDAKICLSEAKIGLIPAVILPYLGRKMNYGDLTRYGLTADKMDGREGQRVGLIQKVVSKGELDKTIGDEINLLLTCSPEAQEAFKALSENLRVNGFQQSDHTAKAIAKIRSSELAQKGLHAFLHKQTPPWVQKNA